LGRSRIGKERKEKAREKRKGKIKKNQGKKMRIAL